MFDKILIANRGEIACRVMRTARRMGVRTVAVFSEADRNAQHVLQADESYCIGESAATASYLKGDVICDVASRTGAQAVHPGYGFLSENAGFADMCEQQGLSFIGPPSSAIISMGSKSESKHIMTAAGVECTPGYHGDDQSDDRLVQEGLRVGFPLMLKAVMGGGGKGMRVVNNEKELLPNIQACQREALASFGDGRILIEKFLPTPRHVELQVFADKHGNCVHLFERDCSVQRRHQKVLEESPAPGMTTELREKMGLAATRAAKAVGYCGAGTVEFMLDHDDSFYFMEMNTRLQVEHPVTEMVTGVDLVEWQLRVASGEPLPIIDQAAVPLMGHSLEARVYAESPGNGFLPGSGRIDFLREPKTAPCTTYPNSKFQNSLRIETGVTQGDSVSVFYDPMISKVVVHGPDRDSALRQMESALKGYNVSGLPTNIEFLLACLKHPEFQKGGVDTSFISEYEGELLGNPPPRADDAKAAAMAVLSRSLLAQKDKTMPFGFRAGDTMRYSQNLEFNLTTEDGADTRHCSVSASLIPQHMNDGIAYDVKVQFDDDETFQYTVKAQQNAFDDQGIASITVDNENIKVVPVIDAKTGDTLLFDVSNAFDRALFRVQAISKAAANDGPQGLGIATAPMPGKIIKVLVQDGDTVEKDQPLIIMEAMKMEHVIKSQTDGTVTELSVTVDDFVDDSKVLCKIE